MCIGGSPSVPPAPAKLPEAPVAPPPSVLWGESADNRRKRAAAGVSGTILTSSRGVTNPAPTTAKTLLGQ